MNDEPTPQASTDESAPAASAEETAVEGDLDQLVAELRRERDEYLDLAQRARADFDNYRRRSAREGQDALVRGKAEVGRAVLPAMDALERALASDAAPGREAEEAAGGGLAEGLALVHRELMGALAAAGVETIDPAGERFDPNLHEALSSRPAQDGEDPGLVVETAQRGYRIGATLLRPARVVVTS